MRKVYLASPYSHPDESIRVRRYEAAVKVAAKIMQLGNACFSPISHTHAIGLEIPQEKHEFWMAQDIPFLLSCDELWVLCLDGWDKSKGVAEEIEVAKKHGMYIHHVHPHEFDVANVLLLPEPAGYKPVADALEAQKRDVMQPMIDRVEQLLALESALAELPPSAKQTNPKDAIADTRLPLHLVSPVIKAYQAVAHVLGNIKYGAWNWRPAGARASVYYSAQQRHMDAWWEGEKYDPTDGTWHLANAQACINILIECQESGNLVDDRPPSRSDVLARVRKEAEEIMAGIKAKYPDRKPRHYTIADTELRLK